MGNGASSPPNCTVFILRRTTATVRATRQRATLSYTHRINLLEVQLEAERQQHCTASEVIEDLRRDRDKWRDQAAGLLTDQRPDTGKPPQRLTWRERLTGKASARPSEDSGAVSLAGEGGGPPEQAAWEKP